jgi:hypothetical protein
MRDRQYPETVVEILDDQMTFPSDLLQAVQEFADIRPWEGSTELRQEKFRQLNRSMAEACGIDPPKLFFGKIDGGSTGGSHYRPRDHRIVITGKLSVVTFLHEFAHALGYGEREACRWSINLFRKCFPRQFSRLIHVGHMLIRPEAVAQRINCGTGAKTTRSATLDAASQEPVTR